MGLENLCMILNQFNSCQEEQWQSLVYFKISLIKKVEAGIDDCDQQKVMLGHSFHFCHPFMKSVGLCTGKYGLFPTSTL